ncbi:MAG: tRNA (adenosine(37)-N6)-threonylcarbamoyltransferase complex dimerization subunit type 1 TsaB, partial [Gammaproteobacteria bacterium]|nr:tRNA (adenosine(37)-N6)-threonylcarbamoyltransferase complex dimerization subunit type 1 TsaB [Gammaproteobacteria bacterium]
ARLTGARRVAAALDARRDEIYFAALEFPSPLAAGLVVIADCVLAPEDLALADAAAWLAVGNGWSIYGARLPAEFAAMPRHELLYPHASDIARLGLAAHLAGASVAACDAHPFYLRGALD